MKKMLKILFNATIIFLPIWTIVLCGWLEKATRMHILLTAKPLFILIPIASYILTGLMCAAIASVSRTCYHEKATLISHIISGLLAILLGVVYLGVCFHWFYFDMRINNFIENFFSSLYIILFLGSFTVFIAIRAVILYLKQKR